LTELETHDFPKSARLLKPKDYSGVFNNVKVRVSHRHMLILATPNNLGRARVGLVFSKKTLKLSVQRNRIKRQVRETFRHQTSLPGLDIVVLSRQGLGDLANAEVAAILKDLWRRLEKKSQGSV
jgi:ribonuclease P protein component